MPKETKFTLALMLVISACFGVVIWQKMEHQKNLVATLEQQAHSGPGGQHDHKHPHPKKPGVGTSPPASPFEQFDGQAQKPVPAKKNEPGRLNPPGGVQNPFDAASKTASSDRPGTHSAQKPPQGLFETPVPKPARSGPDGNPFQNFNESQAQKPAPAKPLSPAGQSPFDSIPNNNAQVKPAPAPAQPGNPAGMAPQNPFDGGGFPTAQPGTNPAPRPNPPSPSGFPVAGQKEAPAPSAGFNPFDSASQNPFDAAGSPRPSVPVKPAVDNKPAGGFNPFTPVQHSEEKQASGQSDNVNPFDTMSLPEASPKPVPPPQNLDKPGSSVPSVPSPFDGFPLENAPTKPTPTKPAPTPQKPDSARPAPRPQPPQSTQPSQPTRPEAPRPEAPRPTQPPQPGSGFDHHVTIDPQEPVRIYTVQADETFWSISQKVYGTSRYFQALAEHNRHRVGDPKNLRPGMKILVPEDKLLERLYGKILPGGGRRHGEQREEVTEGLFFSHNGAPLYRIGKEDTLSDIAQKHLGRSSRWVEIYHMNREVIQTPDRLKLGAVLKMPGDASRIVYEPDSEPRFRR